MSDRLKELQRQRALAQEQLAWFDREIARESGPAALPRFATPVPSAPAPVAARPKGPVETVEADEIIARFKQEAGSDQQNVKLGCWIAFATAFVLLGAGVLVLYLVSRRG